MHIRRKLRKSGLKNHAPEFVSSNHLPSASPDLNLLDYKLWSVLEGKICTRCHHNLESTQALVEAVDNFPIDVVCTDDLTDMGTVLWQMAAILYMFFFLFVVHCICNKLCEHFSNQTSNLHFFG